jgi:hypothetical protein
MGLHTQLLDNNFIYSSLEQMLNLKSCEHLSNTASSVESIIIVSLLFDINVIHEYANPFKPKSKHLKKIKRNELMDIATTIL